MGSTIKSVLYNMMFPLVGLRKAYGFLKDKFVEKISSLPVIGSIFKKLVGAVKDINEGNLANKLEAALNDTKTEQKTIKATKIPADKLNKLNSVEADMYNHVMPTLMSSHRPVNARELADREAARMSTEMAARRRGMEALNKQLGGTFEKGQNQTTAAIIQNTNVMASSHNAQTTNNNGSYGRNAFDSGYGFATDVTACNIR